MRLSGLMILSILLSTIASSLWAQEYPEEVTPCLDKLTAGEMEAAYDLCITCNRAAMAHEGLDPVVVMNGLIETSNQYYFAGYLDAAMVFNQMALDHADSLQLPHDENYASYLLNLFAIAFQSGNKEIVLRKGQETAALILQFAGNTPELVYVHTAMGVAYLADGQLAESEENFELASAYQLELAGMPDSTYFNIQLQLSDVYEAGGDLNKAIQHTQKVLTGIKEAGLQNEALTADGTLNLFYLAFVSGSTEMVLQKGPETARLLEKVYGSTPDLVWVYTVLGTEYLLRSQLAESEESFELASAHQLIVTGAPDSTYFSLQLRLSEVYQLYGDHIKAIEKVEEVMAEMEAAGMHNSALLADSYDLMMLAATELNDEAALVEYVNGLMEVIGELPIDVMASKYFNMVIAINRFDIANGTRVITEYGLDTITFQVLEAVGKLDIDPMILSNGYLVLGNIYLMDGLYDKVYVNYDKASSLVAERYGKDFLYITYRNTMAICAEKQGQPELAKSIYEDNFQLTERIIQNNFAYLPEQAQAQLIQNMGFVRTCFASFTMRYAEVYPDMLAALSEEALLFQGAVLRNASGIRNRLLTGGDPQDAELVDNWLRMKQQAAAVRFSNPDQADALDKQAEELEKKFSLGIKRKSTEQEALHWSDLQNEMLAGTAVVQFLRIESDGYFRTGPAQYCALVTRSGLERPELITLCDEEQLASLLSARENEPAGDHVRRLYLYPDPLFPEDTTDYQGDRLYQMIWQPLEASLTGTDTIHYAPVGLLHRIAFQALSDGDSLLLQRYVMLQEKDPGMPPSSFESVRSILAVGGIDYGLSETAVAVADDRGSGWSPLPGTRQEVDMIANMAEAKQISCTVLTDGKAREDILTDQQLLSADVLHLGTHGFFLPAEPNPVPEAGDPGYQFRTAESPLMRSGLLLSGGNTSWIQGSTGNVDGILTASEISNLNMLDIELVVLSACETGLGDIQGDEGVYGLQRAFAMAGAQNLIMSLWKVPDRYTAELMTRFYTYLLEPSDPATALRRAQLDLSTRTDVYNWAAFVLVR